MTLNQGIDRTLSIARAVAVDKSTIPPNTAEVSVMVGPYFGRF